MRGSVTNTRSPRVDCGFLYDGDEICVLLMGSAWLEHCVRAFVGFYRIIF